MNIYKILKDPRDYLFLKYICIYSDVNNKRIDIFKTIALVLENALQHVLKTKQFADVLHFSELHSNNKNICFIITKDKQIKKF